MKWYKCVSDLMGLGLCDLHKGHTLRPFADGACGGAFTRLFTHSTYPSVCTIFHSCTESINSGFSVSGKEGPPNIAGSTRTPCVVFPPYTTSYMQDAHSAWPHPVGNAYCTHCSSKHTTHASFFSTFSSVCIPMYLHWRHREPRYVLPLHTS